MAQITLQAVSGQESWAGDKRSSSPAGFSEAVEDIDLGFNCCIGLRVEVSSWFS